jgi:hypothetical protein
MQHSIRQADENFTSVFLQPRPIFVNSAEKSIYQKSSYARVDKTIAVHNMARSCGGFHAATGQVTVR